MAISVWLDPFRIPRKDNYQADNCQRVEEGHDAREPLVSLFSTLVVCRLPSTLYLLLLLHALLLLSCDLFTSITTADEYPMNVQGFGGRRHRSARGKQ
jgi:hypothetical protein